MATYLGPPAPSLRRLEFDGATPSNAGRIHDSVRPVRFILVSDTSHIIHGQLVDGPWAWLSSVVSQAHLEADFYEFQYVLRHGDSDVWQALNEVGDVLLSRILELEWPSETASRSIVLVSHALGGIPAKKAINRLSDRLYDVAARCLWEKIILMVNIGCPNPSLERRDRWPRLDHILRHDRKMSSKGLKAASEEAAIVANLCSKFREADIHFRLLTTFETEATTQRHALWKVDKRILLDRDFAETGVYDEQLIPLDLSARNLQALRQSSPSIVAFKDRVVSALRDCSELATGAHQQPSQPSPFTRNLFESTVSPSSHGNLPLELSDPTGKATVGLVSHRPTSPDTASQAPAPKVRIPCYVLGRHPRNPQFHGRSDIINDMDAQLLPQPWPRDRIRPGQTTLQSFAICGLGGMGKTQLALEYAFSRQNQFDAMFWIQADAKQSIAEGFATVATSLGIANESEVSDLAVSFSIVLKWLSDPDSEVSWLIIFDNADTIELIHDFWPSMGTGSVLITTRDPAGKDFCLGSGVFLQPLTEMDSLHLLKSVILEDRTTANQDDRELSSLTSRLGGLPLAIVQVGSLIRRRSMTVAEFSQALDMGAHKAGLSQYQALQHDTGYNQSLFTVWAFEVLDIHAQSLLNVMGFLSPFGIQERLLKSHIEGTELTSYPSDGLTYLDARSNLLKSSLIIRDIASEQVELHPLVKDVVQDRMTGAQKAAHFAICIALVHDSWPGEKVKWGHETSHRELSGQLVPHVLHLKAAYEKYSITVSSRTEELWIELLKDCGWYMLERGEHSSSLPIFLFALKIARKRIQDAPALVADVLMSLSALSIHTNKPSEVIDFSREHLNIRQKVYGQYEAGNVPLQTSYDFAMGIATMAMAYNRADMFEEALKESETAIAMYRSFDLYKDWETVPYFAVAHIGWTLWSLGRLQEAEDVLLEAVNADRKRGKEGSYGLAGILLPLGNVQNDMKKFDEARASHQAAFDMFYAANGNNYKTSQARLKLADYKIREGRLDDAWQDYKIVMNSFEGNHFYKPELARTKIKASRLQKMKGNHLLTQELTQQAQVLLDAIGISTDAASMTDAEMTKMVRIWSR